MLCCDQTSGKTSYLAFQQERYHSGAFQQEGYHSGYTSLFFAKLENIKK
jgi:hypothetical protein